MWYIAIAFYTTLTFTGDCVNNQSEIEMSFENTSSFRETNLRNYSNEEVLLWLVNATHSYLNDSNADLRSSNTSEDRLLSFLQDVSRELLNTNFAEANNNDDTPYQNISCLGGPYVKHTSTGIKVTFLFVITAVFYSINVIKEIFEFATSPSKKVYCKQLENIGQWALIILTLISTSLLFGLISQNEINNNIQQAYFAINQVNMHKFERNQC